LHCVKITRNNSVAELFNKKAPENSGALIVISPITSSKSVKNKTFCSENNSELNWADFGV
jgi:hypothetical protein